MTLLMYSTEIRIYLTKQCFSISQNNKWWILPKREMEADVGGDDWTKIRRRMKKLENRLIPVKNAVSFNNNKQGKVGGF